jgi:hypothetical protein
MEDDEYIIDISSLSTDTISISMPSNPIVGDMWIDSNNISVYSSNNDWISIADSEYNIDLNNITIVEPVEFEDQMPSVAKIEDMCRDYPGLEKAYENFKTVYKLVHQDWRGRQDADKDSPF